jgi:hypothetical protein
MKKVSAAKATRAGYPRLRAAWALLAFAPGVAHADLTLTPQPRPDGKPPTNDTHDKNDHNEQNPNVTRRPTPPRPEPPLMGKIACPRPPRNDPPPNVQNAQPPGNTTRAHNAQPQTPRPPPPGLPPSPQPPQPPPLLRTPDPPPPPDAHKAPVPAPRPKPPEPPNIDGDIARAHPPAPPYIVALSNIMDVGGFVIHPHGPEEPCEPILVAATESDRSRRSPGSS